MRARDRGHRRGRGSLDREGIHGRGGQLPAREIDHRRGVGSLERGNPQKRKGVEQTPPTSNEQYLNSNKHSFDGEHDFCHVRSISNAVRTILNAVHPNPTFGEA